MLKKIISGGQTGVDRGALNAALKYKFPCGGWCPAGRRSEDGFIPAHYPLKEMPTTDYLDRTRRNVEDSDATLIVTYGIPNEGTKDTVNWAYKLSKSYMIVDLEKGVSVSEISTWIKVSHIKTLNIAGPRESTYPGICNETAQLVELLLDELLI